ncbi:MAG TPA: pre-mycofactocin synthase MftD [Solirubrobacterales bacterium]|nr:pre-mycofactocin synthase MftD [Solirubrobacterales bacterium]
MAGRSAWFESVAEAERRAKKSLPRSVFQALRAGSETGGTLGDNVRAFGEIGLIPRIGTGLDERDLSTSVMGQEIAMPVMISPTGVQAVHPDGETAVARAASGAGTAIGLSSFASRPIEEVAVANPKLFFQVYWMGDREDMKRVLERARLAGAKGLIVTLDWVFSHRRDWGSPAIPDKLDLKNMAVLAPQALVRPRWLARYVKAGRLPDLGVPNVTGPGAEPPGFFDAYGAWMTTGQPTWDDLAWLRETWGGPTMIKGVYHPDDARSAVEIGADAISVSNHGGNNLDSTPASIRALPGIAEAVAGRVEILLDGGVRRGSDVVKALALGARAVMIGRAYLWGLAANGEAGVANVLEIFRAGIDETLLGLGRESIGDLVPEDVLLPDGFALVPPA